MGTIRTDEDIRDGPLVSFLLQVILEFAAVLHLIESRQSIITNVSICAHKTVTTLIQTRRSQFGHRNIYPSEVLWPSLNMGTKSWKTQLRCFRLRLSAVMHISNSVHCESLRQLEGTCIDDF